MGIPRGWLRVLGIPRANWSHCHPWWPWGCPSPSVSGSTGNAPGPWTPPFSQPGFGLGLSFSASSGGIFPTCPWDPVPGCCHWHQAWHTWEALCHQGWREHVPVPWDGPHHALLPLTSPFGCGFGKGISEPSSSQVWNTSLFCHLLLTAFQVRQL